MNAFTTFRFMKTKMIKGKTKMKCLECGNEKFTIEDVPETVDFKGETITVSTPSYVCENCEFTLTDTEQMNAFRRAVSDRYREIKGLLTSEDIKAYRNKLGMSQEQFADYLKVGVASIKRWETYFIQDASQDDHIRLKCDKEYSELISLILHEPNIFTGRKKFDLQSIQNAIIILIPVFKSPLFINKALFYADFLHYKKYGIGITGSVYCSLERGPCPDKFKTIFKIMENEGYIIKDKAHDLLAIKDIDPKAFNDRQFEILNQIIKIGEKQGKDFLLNLSHKEPAFLKNPFASDEISYSYAKDLKITKYL